MRFSKIIAKREFHSNTSVPQKKQEKHQINNLNLHLKQLEEITKKSPKVDRKKDHKDQSRNK